MGSGNDTPRPSSKTPPNRPVILAGVVAIVVALALLGWGVAPAKGFAAAGDAFGGSAPSNPEAITDAIDAAMAGLQARAWATILGFVLLLGGFITAKMGGPKEKSVTDQVREAVEAELAGRAAAQPVAAAPDLPPVAGWAPPAPDPGIPSGWSPPAGLGQVAPPATRPREEAGPPLATTGAGSPTPPPDPLPMVSPARSAGAGARCPDCGSIKVAGGRICPRCG